jgi:multiple sugar transport system permease protein
VLPLVVPKFLAADAFFIFLMVQFFRGIPRELDEAAQMDGCSPWRIYLKIIMPLSLPVLATAGIFSFLWTWNDFLGPLVYLNDSANYTVPLALRSFVDATGTSAWGQLFAMSTLAILPIFLVFLCFQRLIIEGVAMSGMKR